MKVIKKTPFTVYPHTINGQTKTKTKFCGSIRITLLSNVNVLIYIYINERLDKPMNNSVRNNEFISNTISCIWQKIYLEIGFFIDTTKFELPICQIAISEWNAISTKYFGTILMNIIEYEKCLQFSRNIQFICIYIEIC